MPPRYSKPHHQVIPPMNPHSPFPDSDAKSRAEVAADDLFTRYSQAMVTLNRLDPDATTAEVGQALRCVADLSAEVCRMVAIGWHFDQPF